MTTLTGHVDHDGTRYHWTYSAADRRIEEVWRDDAGPVPDDVYELCDTAAGQALYARADRDAAEREDADDARREMAREGRGT